MPLREDTSAGMVLQALKQNWPDLPNYQHVTANHFDIDALVGVWALLHPELALQHEETLRQVAVIGDFRELDLSNPVVDKALKLVCWLNAEEKARFYPPFGAEELEENEVVASIPKFHYFLEAFTQVLENPEAQQHVWRPDYDQVLAGYRQIHSPDSHFTKREDLGVIIIETPEPVHYYALFGPTAGYDIVISCYDQNRYEVECKYTTWVDLHSRPTLPRPDLSPLAQILTQLEMEGQKWSADGVTDTGPLLRLQKEKLTKAQRYGNPMERIIYPSSISKDVFVQTCLAYFEKVFAGISPKKYWTWAEVKAFSKS